MLPIISCKKEAKLSVSEKSMFPSWLRIDMTGISSDKEMLVFFTKELFDSTLAELDDLNLKDTVVHYDNTESIILRTELDDFESNFQYQSLRKHLKEQKIIYLYKGGDPNENTDKEGFELDDNNPDKYFIADIAMQSVLNKYNEVQIAGKVYKYINQGLMLEIKNCDQNLLDKLRNQTINYYFDQNIKVKHLNGGPLRGCAADYTFNTLDVDLIEVNGDLSFSDSPINNYKWEWGDGSESNNANSYTTHFYTSSGNFPVTLTITCNDGCTSTVTYNIA
ncbi:MAG: PKD domain-containing protein, partial [Ignavibacteria bacterium]|nr:PKD domain-containing protein [Ignavibacteria bacterium]